MNEGCYTIIFFGHKDTKTLVKNNVIFLHFYLFLFVPARRSNKEYIKAWRKCFGTQACLRGNVFSLNGTSGDKKGRESKPPYRFYITSNISNAVKYFRYTPCYFFILFYIPRTHFCWRGRSCLTDHR
jgi:hypothetical protein